MQMKRMENVIDSVECMGPAQKDIYDDVIIVASCILGPGSCTWA